MLPQHIKIKYFSFLKNCKLHSFGWMFWTSAGLTSLNFFCSFYSTVGLFRSPMGVLELFIIWTVSKICPFYLQIASYDSKSRLDYYPRYYIWQIPGKSQLYQQKCRNSFQRAQNIPVATFHQSSSCAVRFGQLCQGRTIRSKYYFFVLSDIDEKN